MEKLNLISKIQEIYSKGENIINYLKKIDKRDNNTIEDILISYDFQAGSYIRHADNNKEYINNYTNALASVILKLGSVATILEVGVGEATTLANLAKKLTTQGTRFGGFDISWSRIHFAKKYLASLNVSAFVCTGDLFMSPFTDSSIDIVYTSHSIEPNGGREEEALNELYRITNKYLVLLEPSFELAGDEAKQRMLKNGYITNLKAVIEKLGYTLLEYRLFDYSSNPLNPTALYIIEKNRHADNKQTIDPYCPIGKTRLQERADHFFSEKSLLSYPKIDSIPCLTPFNAILTSKMNED